LQLCHQHRFRYGPLDLDCLIDDDTRHSPDVVLDGQLWELDGLHRIGPDVVALDSQFVSQAHGLGAVRSGGGDENLKVHGLCDSGQGLLGGRQQFYFPFGDINDVLDERAELVA